MQRDRITDAARGRWHGILSAMGVASSFLNGRHGPCPFCGAGKDRFRFADKDGDGRWFCNQCGNGDGFDFVQRLRGCDFTEAARLVREQVGTAPVRSSKPVADGEMRKALNGLWRSSKPVADGDPVSRWLSRRVGKIIVPKSIRFCQKCRYWDADTKDASLHPAMIAMISGADGRPALLHKTYLTPDGQKASVQKVRMLMPGTFPAGAAVRLFDASERMGIAEGIETAFAASILFGIPVWAALNAGALEKWQPPAGARQIIVFGDNDGNFTGQRAAFSLGQRLGREGFSVSVQIPEREDTDWNDVLSSRALKERTAA